MNTWISKGAVFGCALAITACAEGTPGFSLLSPNTGPNAPSSALSQTSLARGALVLVAPKGYCIDGQSLRDNFALMTRCDALNADQPQERDVPLALMTVSLVRKASVGEISEEDLGLTNETELERIEQDGLTLVRVAGDPPVSGMASQFWRAAGHVNGHVVGLAFYVPNRVETLPEPAPEILAEVIEGSQVPTILSGIDE